MKILVVNCGSSSIKFQLYQMPARQVLARGQVERIGDDQAAFVWEAAGRKVEQEKPVPNHEAGMELILGALVAEDVAVLEELSEIAAVGHRVVHGGEAFTASVLIDENVMASIRKCADLAPLHNPANLTGIRAARHALPQVPHVACFDTAFHATIPKVAYLYALPYEVYQRYGVRRYGFHGTSHRYVARRTAELLGREPEDLNCITAHLGNGCSMAAIRGGQSVDTSMGLTPLEGLVMGTRSGDIDPAILFYLADKGFEIETLNTLCNKKSGLLGISGVSNDMRTLAKEAAGGSAQAQLAIDVFCYRVKKYIGAYMAVLGRVDAICFTGGIGEHVPEVRARICGELDSLGIHLDANKNETCRGEMTVSEPSSSVKVLVVPTDEEGVIATDTFSIVEELIGSQRPETATVRQQNDWPTG